MTDNHWVIVDQNWYWDVKGLMGIYPDLETEKMEMDDYAGQIIDDEFFEKYLKE
jgi:hypothetical protein